MVKTTKKCKSAAAELWPENVPVAQENNAHNNRTRCARGDDMTYLNSTSPVCLLSDPPPHASTVCICDVFMEKKDYTITKIFIYLKVLK